MLWIILIVLIIVGACTNNFTPLKVFGKIVAWFFGIMLAICLIVTLIGAIIIKISDANNKKEQDAYWESYWESVYKTPLIQWACDSYGRQLHLGERPNYVYQCSTGEMIAQNLIGNSYYTCIQKPHKQVNHWKFCKHKVDLSNSKYSNLLGN